MWVLLTLPNPAASTSRHSCGYEYTWEAFSFWRSCLSVLWEDTVPTASSDRAWHWSHTAPPHSESPRNCKARVKCKSPLLPHQGLRWQFPLRCLFRWHLWVIHAEQLFSCCYGHRPLCLKCRFWVGVLLWKGEVWGVSELFMQPILRNWFYFCLIPVVFIRRTAGLVTAPGEIKLTEPVCSRKINRSGLWV